MNMTSDGSTPPPPPAHQTTLILETTGPNGASRLLVTELFSLGEMDRMLNDQRALSRPCPTIYAVLDINSGFKRYIMQATSGSMVRSMGEHIYVRVDDVLVQDIRMAKGAAIMVVHENIDGSMRSQTFTHLGDGFFGLTVFR